MRVKRSLSVVNFKRHPALLLSPLHRSQSPWSGPDNARAAARPSHDPVACVAANRCQADLRRPHTMGRRSSAYLVGTLPPPSRQSMYLRPKVCPPCSSAFRLAHAAVACTCLFLHSHPFPPLRTWLCPPLPPPPFLLFFFFLLAFILTGSPLTGSLSLLCSWGARA